MSDGYRKQRNIFGNDGGSLLVTTLTGTTTLLAAKPASVPKSPLDASDGGYTIWVQRVHLHISTGSAGVTWQVTDSGSGVSLTGVVSTVSVTTTVGQDTSVPTEDPIQAEYDFGPEGVAITGNLVFTASGTGASGVITWDAYQKLTSTQPFGS